MLVLRFPVELELTRTSCMECSDYQVSNIPFLSTSYFCKKCELSFTFFYCSVSGRLAHLGHDSASIHRSTDCGFYGDSRQCRHSSRTLEFKYPLVHILGDLRHWALHLLICSLSISYRILVIVV